MFNSIVDKISEIARPIVEAREAFIVDLRMRGERASKIVEIFIDADRGVTTELCADVSRELSRELDLLNILTGRYHLVVSSPGIDRPLKFARQYRRHIGRTLTVKHRTAVQPPTLEGELIEAGVNGIEIRVSDGTVLRFSFDEIVEARVKPAW